MDDPIIFLIDCMKDAMVLLEEYTFLDISILAWISAFIVTNMVISVFWRGARG